MCGPFGAVKEQAAGLYAQTMAERGFLTIAFDPSYTGESEGQPRYVVSPDINTEDFSAAIDFLATNDMVDPERIGIIGICGWGGLGITAASADPRIKATVASTMYDMSRVNANGYFDADDSAEARNKLRKALAAQRTEDYRNGFQKLGGGVPDVLPDRRASISERLLRLLQNTARLSSPFAQFQSGEKRHDPDTVHHFPAYGSRGRD